MIGSGRLTHDGRKGFRMACLDAGFRESVGCLEYIERCWGLGNPMAVMPCIPV